MIGSFAKKQAAPRPVSGTHDSAIETVAHEHTDLMLRLSELRATTTPAGFEDANALAKQSIKKIERVGEQSVGSLDAVADSYSDITAPLRQFMLDNGVDRPVRSTNVVKSTLILQGCMAVEAAATAGLLASDGTMGIAASLLTGTIFSGVNIALGVAAGFFGLRGMSYRSKAEEPKRVDELIRWGASAFIAASAAGMAIMHFGAARVRVTGEHSGIWDWETVPFLATFGDYNALALLVIGALSSVVAIREGWGQLSDPIWGYSQATAQTEQRIKDALDQAFNESSDRLDAALESSVDRIEAAITESDDAREDRNDAVETLREEVAHFNTRLKLLKSRLKSAQTKETKRRQYLAGIGAKIDPVRIDLAALRSLAINEAMIPHSQSPATDMSKHVRRIEDAHDDANAKIEAAHASVSSLATLPFSIARSHQKEKK